MTHLHTDIRISRSGGYHLTPGLPRRSVGTINSCYWLAGCLTPRQHATASQGPICSDYCACCHTAIEGAVQTSYLTTRSHHTDTRPTSPSGDPMSSSTLQVSHRKTSFEITGTTQPRKIGTGKRESNPGLPLSRRTPYH